MSVEHGELPRRKILGHIPPPWVDPGSIFFVTICAKPRGENQLCHPVIADALFEGVQFRAQRQIWHCEVFLLMPDHVHALLAFPADGDMRRTIANFKEMTAKRIGIHWQRGFFDHRLRGGEQIQLKTDYIRQNPVRAGLARDATAWPYVWPR